PANEIVFPIIVMGYMAQGHLTELADLSQLRELLVGHGWTGLTAVCVMLFCAMHWPCSTTCLTIRRETGSWRWTALAVALPTLTGLTVCFLVAAVGRLLGFG
ncbi:MAG: ferrous iron transporter B, partial [Acutalibacteraceae bacterium]